MRAPQLVIHRNFIFHKNEMLFNESRRKMKKRSSKQIFFCFVSRGNARNIKIKRQRRMHGAATTTSKQARQSVTVHIANFLRIHKIMLCAFTSLKIQLCKRHPARYKMKINNYWWRDAFEFFIFFRGGWTRRSKTTKGRQKCCKIHRTILG